MVQRPCFPMGKFPYAGSRRTNFTKINCLFCIKKKFCAKRKNNIDILENAEQNKVNYKAWSYQLAKCSDHSQEKRGRKTGNLSATLAEELESKTAFTIPVFGGVPIAESVVVTWVIMAVLLILSLVLVRNLKVENPGRNSFFWNQE